MNIETQYYHNIDQPLVFMAQDHTQSNEPLMVSSLLLIQPNGQQQTKQDNESIALDLIWKRMQRITRTVDYYRHPRQHVVYSWLTTLHQKTHVISTCVIGSEDKDKDKEKDNKHVLVAFVEDYRLDGSPGPCWGPMANQWLTNHGIHVGGRFYHAFWDKT